MFCTNCGKAVEPDTKFCPNCGANQMGESPPSSPTPTIAAAPVTAPPVTGSAVPLRAGKPAVWAGIVALVLVIVGGLGYWGWNNKVGNDEAVRKRDLDEVVRKATDINTAEIKAAQILLEKHIAAEEAQANSQGTTRRP